MAKESELLHTRMEDVSTQGLYFTSDQRPGVGTRFNLSTTATLLLMLKQEWSE
jgi:hypothetical protein